MSQIYISDAQNAKRMAARRLRIGDSPTFVKPDGALQGFRRTDAAFVFSPVSTEVSSLIEDQYNQELFFRIYNNTGSDFTPGKLLTGSTTLTAKASSASSVDIEAGNNMVIPVADATDFRIGMLCQLIDGVDETIDYAIITDKSGNDLMFDIVPYDLQIPTITAMQSVSAVLADADSAGVALWVVKDAIPNGSFGWVYGSAIVTGLVTNSFSVGAKVYLSSTAGVFSTIPSLATQTGQWVGTVEVSHATEGIIRFFPWRKAIEKIGRGMIQSGAYLPASGISAGFLIGDGSGNFVEHALSSDITVSTGGVVTIANDAITNAKVAAAAAIAYSKLNLALGIVNGDISASAAIAFSKLAALTSGNILVGNGSNVAVSVTPSGEITISNAGVFTAAFSQRSKVSSQFDKTNTTLADITGLSANLVSGKRYNFKAILHVFADGTGGSKVSVNGTATASAIIYQANILNNGTGLFVQNGRITALGSGGVGVSSSGTLHYIEIIGQIACNGNGTLTIQFAQNSANGTSSVLVCSSLTVEEVP